eukprot:6141311-Alexandrium_andersonii.AAC.1
MLRMALCIGIAISTRTSMGNAMKLTSVARAHGCTAVVPARMPSFDTVDKEWEDLVTAAVALPGAVALRFTGWARSHERYDTIKRRLVVASMTANCQVARQACFMGRRHHAYGGLRAGMQADDEEDQAGFPPGWTRTWSHRFNRPLYVHQGPGHGGVPIFTSSWTDPREQPPAVLPVAPPQLRTQSRLPLQRLRHQQQRH